MDALPGTTTQSTSGPNARLKTSHGPWPGLVALWIASAVIVPAALYGLWAAPAMRVMDSLRRAQPKADWVLVLHSLSFQLCLAALVILLLVAALHGLKGRHGRAKALLVHGCGALFAVSITVLAIVWI